MEIDIKNNYKTEISIEDDLCIRNQFRSVDWHLAMETETKRSYLSNLPKDQIADVVYDLIESFPKFENVCMDLFTSFILQERTGKSFEQEIKQIYFDHIRNCIATIKQEAKNKKLYYAYMDVARYQTDPLDAAIEWQVNINLLNILLERKPVPTTVEDRLALSVPQEVIKKRELF